jgi:hypothetical protein
MPSRSRSELWFLASLTLSSCAVYEATLVRPTVDEGEGATVSGGSAPLSGGAGNAAGGKPALGGGGNDEHAGEATGGSNAPGPGSAGEPAQASAGESAGGADGSEGGRTGTEGGTEASVGGAPGDACVSTSVGSGLLGAIDDFDDGDAALQAIDGRSGSWLFSSDGTGTTMPMPGAPVPVAGGVTGSALHLQGTGLTGEGAALHATMTDSGDCYDASAYRGLNIALKGSGEVWLVVRTAPVDAEPAGKRDYHRLKLGVNAGWTTYTTLWSQLGQSGLTGATKVEFDATVITGIDIVPTSSATPLSFDFWVDNIAFRKKA